MGRRKKINYEEELNKIILEKIRNTSAEDLIELMAFGAAVYVVYDTILKTEELVEEVKRTVETAMIPGAFLMLPTITWWAKLIQLIVPPEAVPPTEPTTPEEKVKNDLVKEKVIAISLCAAYIIIYKSEVLTGLAGGMISFIRGFIK